MTVTITDIITWLVGFAFTVYSGCRIIAMIAKHNEEDKSK